MSAVAAGDSSEDLSDLVPNDDEAEDAGDSGDEAAFVKDSESPCIAWCGASKKFPIFIFSPLAVERRDSAVRSVGEKYHMAFKIVKTDCKLLKTILLAHGFRETHANSPDFNLMWTGSHLKPYVLRSLTEFQKVNHFPRSYELTRKDRLYKNVQRLQQIKGLKHFDFVPPTFVFPAEFQEFCTYYIKDKGPFIVKPIASSRGRGIFIVSHPDQIPLDDQLVVCKYISKPLVVDGFKFDLRIYVAVTSYDPLVIYMYEEGLARFATVKYQAGQKFMRNQCMHLTNYSVNKKNREFVQNDDADVEDYGNKWSLGALLRYLKSEGHDTSALMMRLEDVIVKAIMSVEMPIATACKMFQPHKGNCFELYGFDIIIDEELRPWLLEVNLSPSLACDSPLDFKIKCHMLSDLLSLVGFVCHDPMLRSLHGSKSAAAAGGSRHVGDGPGSAASRSRQLSMAGRPGSTSSLRSVSAGRTAWQPPSAVSPVLTADESRMVRRIREEFHRRGGWLRIFPTPDSWEAYSGFLQSQGPSNLLLHQRLFPGAWRQAKTAPQAAGAKCKVPLHSLSSENLASILDSHQEQHRKVHCMYRSASQRTLCYERRLGSSLHRQRPGPAAAAAAAGAAGAAATVKSSTSDAPSLHRSRSLPPQGKRRQQQAPAQPQSGPHAATLGGEFRGEMMKPDSDLDDDSSIGPASTTGSGVAAASTAAPSPMLGVKPAAFDSEAVIKNGGDMSKVQARRAFAAYLSRVQRRLLGDQQMPDEESGSEAERLANEQLDLVLRFLRRAAGAKLAGPSSKLGLRQRQRILANMLADFVRSYARDTEAMPLEHTGIAESDFTSFLRAADEAQIESLLTTYTRLNKSAGVFIASAAASSAAAAAAAAPPSRRERRSSGGSLNGGAGVSDLVSSSYRTAVQVYSAPVSYKRPTSATGGHLSRPSASRVGVNSSAQSPSPSGLRSLHAYDEAALNEALERLAVRQQSRQFAAYRVSSALGRPGSASRQGALSAMPLVEAVANQTNPPLLGFAGAVKPPKPR